MPGSRNLISHAADSPRASIKFSLPGRATFSPIPAWRTILLFAVLIGIAVAARISEHIPNVAPIAALALLAGSRLRLPWALAVPVGAMLISDSIIGFDQWEITVAVYGSFMASVGLGAWMGSRFSPWRIISASLANSVLFYLVTNAAVWWWSGMYARTSDGLALSYFYALPFFRNTLFGDMVYTFTLFLAVHYVPIAWQFVRLKWFVVPQHNSTIVH